MNTKTCMALFFVSFTVCCSTRPGNKEKTGAQQRPTVSCMENSPERRGDEGCTILANRSLDMSLLSDSVYWHIDRFNSLDAASTAAGPNSVASEAHGSFWLMSVEATSESHHAGDHVASIGPLILPAGKRYSMRVLSSLIMPGATTPAHSHPGPEVIYVVEGEQCMETPDIGIHLLAGQFYVVPDGVIHRGRPIGSKARRSLALNLYDAAHPTSHNYDSPPTLASCE
jgi:quercetin dioxygenase-like cupin family protein